MNINRLARPGGSSFIDEGIYPESIACGTTRTSIEPGFVTRAGMVYKFSVAAGSESDWEATRESSRRINAYLIARSCCGRTARAEQHRRRTGSAKRAGRIHLQRICVRPGQEPRFQLYNRSREHRHKNHKRHRVGVL